MQFTINDFYAMFGCAPRREILPGDFGFLFIGKRVAVLSELDFPPGM